MLLMPKRIEKNLTARDDMLEGEQLQKNNKYFIPQSDYDAVLFSNINNSRIKLKPMYFELGFSPSPAIWARVAVLRRLVSVLQHLPANYGLLIWDVYRTRAVQGQLFEWMRIEIKKRSPLLSDTENYNETLKYMSAPSSIGDDYCPPHLSGGAIDLTFFDINSGLELDMGTAFDDCSNLANRDFFNDKQELTESEIALKNRRHLLKNAMEKAGFTSYLHEWWHFDIGTVFWAKQLGLKPIFGPLFGDDEWPNTSDGLNLSLRHGNKFLST